MFSVVWFRRWIRTCHDSNLLNFLFGFRTSDFFRPSDFGFRPLRTHRSSLEKRLRICWNSFFIENREEVEWGLHPRNYLSGTFSRSSRSHGSASESLGARQSPRGDNEPPEPTLGPFGMAERLNWLVLKKRTRNTSSHFLIAARSYSICFSGGNRSGHSPCFLFPHAWAARKATLLGRNPKRVT